jgi:hypothetical protein
LSRRLSIDPVVLQRLRQLPKAERIECLGALCDLTEGFGHPHRHGGLGIRKLGAKLFECRGNLALRFVFQDRRDEIYVSFLGTHDEVKALLWRCSYG